LRRARVAIGALAAATLVGGCADLLGFKELQLADSGTPDGSTPDVSQPETGPPCDHVRWPDQPDAQGSGTPMSYTLAIEHVRLTTETDGGLGQFGYDLDDHCTVDQTTASCKAASVTVDTNGSIDDTSIQLLNQLIVDQQTVADALSDDALNKTIASGTFTVLIRLIGLEDAENQTLAQGLSVAVQTAPGILSPATPLWDGNDKWSVSAADVAGGLDAGTNSPIKRVSAYVTNGVLVATDPGPVSLSLILPPNTLTGTLPISLTQVVLTGTLVKRSDSNYDITDGTIAGRWSTDDFLRAVGSLDLKSPSDGPLCAALGGGVYDAVVDTVCAHRDINSQGQDDDTASCDAISVAMKFDAVAAEVANSPSPTPVSTTPCVDAGLCPSN